LTQAVGWAVPESFYPSADEIDAELAKNSITPSSPKFELEHQATAERLRAENMSTVSNSWQMLLLGFLVAIGITCIIGFILASLIGRRLWRLIETSIARIPGVKQVYPHVQQVTDYFFGEKKITFSKVVAVQYPRMGVWSIGFVTGPAMACMKFDKSEEYATVFMPSSPTPVTGYVITARWEDMRELDITIDQALRFVISGGVLSPELIAAKALEENSSLGTLPPR